MSDTLHPLDHDRMAGKTLTRLTRDTLDAAHADIRRPGYDPAALVPSILHLGCGAFHRGHQPPRYGKPQSGAAMRAGGGAVALLERGAAEIVALAGRLPPGLPCCLLGGLAEPWRPWLPAELRARLVPPAGDAVDGALHLAGLTG